MVTGSTTGRSSSSRTRYGKIGIRERSESVMISIKSPSGRK